MSLYLTHEWPDDERVAFLTDSVDLANLIITTADAPDVVERSGHALPWRVTVPTSERAMLDAVLTGNGHMHIGERDALVFAVEPTPHGPVSRLSMKQRGMCDYLAHVLPGVWQTFPRQDRMTAWWAFQILDRDVDRAAAALRAIGARRVG